MSFKNKKSQGMSINVVIIAVLGLVVLVVLAAIFTGRVKLFSSGLDRCTGSCEKNNEDCSAKNGVVIPKKICPKNDDKTEKVCCVIIADKT